MSKVVLADHWAEVESPLAPEGMYGDNLLRAVEIYLTTTMRFEVSTWSTGECDKYGKEGIAVAIHQNNTLVYWTGTEPSGLVYIPHSQCSDSDDSILSAVHLCCYDATHGPNDEPKECNWLADELDEAASMVDPDA